MTSLQNSSSSELLLNSGKIEEKDKKIEKDISDFSFSNFLFIRLIAKKKSFKNIDFKYTIFENCYFRDCVFDSCDFTGCRFVGSNFHGSSFSGCKFEYCIFDRSIIDDDILDSGCPGHENLKMRFARSLRINYLQIGDSKSVNKAIAVELQATEVHLRKSWQSNESYYRKKYTGWKRFKIFFEWIKFKALDYIWGNGENSLKLVRAVLVLFFLMALIDFVWFKNHNFTESIINSPQIFFGITSPSNYPSYYLTAILILRLVMMGFFLSIVIKKMGKR